MNKVIGIDSCNQCIAGGQSAGKHSWSIGNGQFHDAMSPSAEVSKTLNCMDDPMKVLIVTEK